MVCFSNSGSPSLGHGQQQFHCGCPLEGVVGTTGKNNPSLAEDFCWPGCPPSSRSALSSSRASIESTCRKQPLAPGVVTDVRRNKKEFRLPGEKRPVSARPVAIAGKARALRGDRTGGKAPIGLRRWRGSWMEQVRPEGGGLPAERNRSRPSLGSRHHRHIQIRGSTSSPGFEEGHRKAMPAGESWRQSSRSGAIVRCCHLPCRSLNLRSIQLDPLPPAPGQERPLAGAGHGRGRGERGWFGLRSFVTRPPDGGGQLPGNQARRGWRNPFCQVL